MKLFTLIVSICVAFTSFAHEFYFSLTEIVYNEQARSLEISIKIFTDDLEQALKAEDAGAISLATDAEHELADEYVEAYIRDHLMITVNGKRLTFDYIGKENEKDATWVYVEIPKVRSVKTVTVYNDLLLEQFEQQTNLVRVDVAGSSQNLILSRHLTKDKVTF